MKICLFSTTFFPRIGGAELVIHCTAKYLTESGHEVTVLVPRFREMKEEIKSDYIIHRYRLFPRLLLLEPVLLAHLLLEKMRTNFDILHAHLAYPPGYLGLRFGKIFKVPVVVTVHGADVQRMPDINYGIRLNPDIDRKVRFTLGKADAVTAISQSIKEEIIRADGKEEKIYDIPNGVEIWRFNKPVKNIRQMLNLSAHTKIILSVGRDHPKKGYPDLLRALPEVLSKYPDAKCIIVGKGTENLKPLAEELGIEDAVLLPGSIPKEKTELRGMNYPHQDLIAIYLGSDVFVLPSLIEGLPLVSVEAMAGGLPIVATNVAGNRDVIDCGVNGFLVEPNNPSQIAEKICLLLEDDSLRRKMGKESKKLAQNYDWKIITERYVEVYKTVA